MINVLPTEADRELTAKILGYADWEGANDYRLTGRDDGNRERVLKLIVDYNQRDRDFHNACIDLVGSIVRAVRSRGMKFSETEPLAGQLGEAIDNLFESKMAEKLIDAITKILPTLRYVHGFRQLAINGTVDAGHDIAKVEKAFNDLHSDTLLLQSLTGSAKQVDS